jgi:hypothetical protein
VSAEVTLLNRLRQVCLRLWIVQGAIGCTWRRRAQARGASPRKKSREGAAPYPVGRTAAAATNRSCWSSDYDASAGLVTDLPPSTFAFVLSDTREQVLLFCLLGLVLTATILLVAAPGAVTWALALIV